MTNSRTSVDDVSEDALLRYAGTELDLFECAVNWKRRIAALVRPWVQGRVLEVGAGTGGTTIALPVERAERWTCLEPDPVLCDRLEERIAASELPGTVDVQVGRIAEVDGSYDCILYIDVLEHIEDDRGELLAARDRLREGGVLIVLSPAFPFLSTPFDDHVGHFRRYTRGSLSEVVPAGLRRERLTYVDSVGMLASLGNRLLLRSAHPTHRQIQFWDRWLVPASSWLDPIVPCGKSVFGAWRRVPGEPVDA